MNKRQSQVVATLAVSSGKGIFSLSTKKRLPCTKNEYYIYKNSSQSVYSYCGKMNYKWFACLYILFFFFSNLIRGIHHICLLNVLKREGGYNYIILINNF